MHPNNYGQQGDVKMHRQRTDDDGDAVSEILGVIMMLAMVITIMGGVWIFSTPTSSPSMTIPTGTVRATSQIASKTALML